MRRRLIMLSAVVLLNSPFVMAQSKYPKDLFAINQLHLDSYRAPNGFQWYLQTREAKAIAASVSSYMGVHPSYVLLALNSLPKANVRGEETFYEVPVPSGYTFCAARIAVRSIFPGSGDRASVINAGATENVLSIYTWTPVNHPGSGQSSVEADAQVMGIKPQYLSEFRSKGICRPPAQAPSIINCRGNPCNPATYGQMQNVAASVPDLTSEGF